MRRYALAVVFGALHVCQAFRTKTSRAWEGAVVKPVTFQSPETPLQAECSGAMGRRGLLGLLKRLPQHLIESFMIVCSTKKDGDLTDQLDEAVRDFDSDDQEVMDFFQGLSLSERRPLWRTAKFYNQMTELTTA